jgi:hypothetical protein
MCSTMMFWYFQYFSVSIFTVLIFSVFFIFQYNDDVAYEMDVNWFIEKSEHYSPNNIRSILNYTVVCDDSLFVFCIHNFK